MKTRVIWLLSVGLTVVLLAGCDFADFLGAMRPKPQPQRPKQAFKMVLKAEAVDGSGSVTAEQLETTKQIVEKRLRELGSASSTVEVGSDRNITVVLRDADFKPAYAQGIASRGFLELLDGGDTPPREGEYVTTALGGPPAGEPQPSDGIIWPVVVTGDDLIAEKTEVTYNSEGQPQVFIVLNEEGTKKLADFTAKNVNRYMPIVMDKLVISVPMIMSEISGGSGVIGNITLADAQMLAANLKSGVLPVNLTVLDT